MHLLKTNMLLASFCKTVDSPTPDNSAAGSLIAHCTHRGKPKGFSLSHAGVMRIPIAENR